MSPRTEIDTTNQRRSTCILLNVCVGRFIVGPARSARRVAGIDPSFHTRRIIIQWVPH